MSDDKLKKLRQQLGVSKKADSGTLKGFKPETPLAADPADADDAETCDEPAATPKALASPETADAPAPAIEAADADIDEDPTHVEIGGAPLDGDKTTRFELASDKPDETGTGDDGEEDFSSVEDSMVHLSFSDLEMVDLLEAKPDAPDAAPPLPPADRLPPDAPPPPVDRLPPDAPPPPAASLASAEPPPPDAAPPPPDAESMPPDAPQEREAQPRPAPIDDHQFFIREATALAEHQPERAGLMWFEAARAAEQAGEDRDRIVATMKTGLDLAPNSPFLVPLIRRSMLRLGQLDSALSLTRRLEQIGGDNDMRKGCLLEAAGIVSYEKKNDKQALTLLGKALELQPGHAVTLAQIAARHLELKQNDQAADAIEMLAEALSSPREQASCLYAAGSIREIRLGQIDRATQDYQRAVEHAHEHLPALIALADLHQLEGSWHELSGTLEQMATLELDPAARASFLLRAGSLHLYRTGDMEAAARTLAGAAVEVLDDLSPLVRLAYAYEVTGHQHELIGTLRQLLTLTVDPQGQATVLTRIGWLHQNRTRQIEEAIQAYRQALDAKPGHLPAMQALGTIFHQRGEFENLIQILLPDTEGTDTEERRAVRCLEIADLLTDRIDRPQDGIDLYGRALELCPDLHLAFWRLYRLLQDERRHTEIARLLARQIDIVSDSKTRNFLQLELADLQADQLQAVDRAIETLEEARAAQRGRSATMRLIDLYQRSSRNTELVVLLLSEADDTTDEKEARWRRIQAAQILEDSLGEHERALEINRDVLKDDPQNAAAIRAAGRIYHRLGRWNELIELHRHEIRSGSKTVDAALLYCRIGRIYEGELGKADQAINSYMKAIREDPGCSVALDALERLVRDAKRFEDLVNVLQRFSETRKDPFAAADALCRAAELADTQLDDLDRAGKLYKAALNESASFQTALGGLYQVYLRQKEYARAAEIMQAMNASQDPPPFHLALQLARLEEFRLDRRAAPELYDATASAAPYGDLLRFETIRIRRLLGDEDLAAALLEIGKRTPDSALATSYLLESAHRFELAGDERALEAANQAHAQSPTELAVIWAFQRALFAQGAWEEYSILLEAEAEQRVEPNISVNLLADAAAARLNAGQPRDAARLASQCLALVPEHLPSLRLLTRLAEEWDNWPELATLLDRTAELCKNSENRRQGFISAADIWSHHVCDPARALISLRAALSDDPGQPEAFSRAERLLENSADHVQLSELMSHRIQACADPRRQADFRLQHARLLRDRLGDNTHAIGELTQLLLLEPKRVEALSDLADLLEIEGRWSDAADTLTNLIACDEDPGRRQRSRLRQATIWLNRLQQPEPARRVLEEALKEQPAMIPAKQLLVDVSFTEGKWDEAQQLLEQVGAEDDPEVQAWAAGQLAEVARVGLRDESLRDRYEREALTLSLPFPHLLQKLIDKYRADGDLSRLVELGPGLASELTNSRDAALLRQEVARVLLEELGQADQAMDLLRDSLILDPENIDGNILLANAMEKKGEMEAAVATYRKVVQIDIACAEGYSGLSRLMGVLGNPAVAETAAAMVTLLNSGGAPQPEEGDDDDVPAGSIDVDGFPLHAAMRPIHRLLRTVIPHMGGVYPLELNSQVKNSHPLVAAAKRLATPLGLSAVKISVEGSVPACVGPGDPVALRIAPHIARRPRSAAFRFWVGRALATAATAGSLLDHLSDGELDLLLEALTTTRPIDSTVQALRKQVWKAMPRKVRKQVEQIDAPKASSDIWQRYREIEQTRADQIGLLLCGKPLVVLTELAGKEGFTVGLANTPRVEDLVMFAISERYASYYSSLWSPKTPSL